MSSEEYTIPTVNTQRAYSLIIKIIGVFIVIIKYDNEDFLLLPF